MAGTNGSWCRGPGRAPGSEVPGHCPVSVTQLSHQSPLPGLLRHFCSQCSVMSPDLSLSLTSPVGLRSLLACRRPLRQSEERQRPRAQGRHRCHDDLVGRKSPGDAAASGDGHNESRTLDLSQDGTVEGAPSDLNLRKAGRALCLRLLSRSPVPASAALAFRSLRRASRFSVGRATAPRHQL